jgi:hypothetical protein
LCINAGNGIYVHADIRDIVSLESRCLDVNFVIIGNQMRDGVAARLIGSGLFRRSLCQIGDRYLRPGDRVALRVGHGTNNTAIHRLTGSGAGAEQKHQTAD